MLMLMTMVKAHELFYSSSIFINLLTPFQYFPKVPFKTFLVTSLKVFLILIREIVEFGIY